MKSNDFPKRLFVVATPIGNLSDMTKRAIDTLTAADLVLCENTAHSLKLLNYFAIRPKKIKKLTDHESPSVMQGYLQMADTIALISDAGTPLVSDPGQQFIALAHQSGFAVMAVPGPSAVIAAISMCPFAAMPFTFLGFLSRKQGERMADLVSQFATGHALVCYESPRRLLALLADMQAVCGDNHPVFVVKELTKRFETSWHGALADVSAQLASDTLQGEFVVVLAGHNAKASGIDAEEVQVSALVDQLLAEALPVQVIKRIVAGVTDLRKNAVYQLILQRQALRE